MAVEVGFLRTLDQAGIIPGGGDVLELIVTIHGGRIIIGGVGGNFLESTARDVVVLVLPFLESTMVFVAVAGGHGPPGLVGDGGALHPDVVGVGEEVLGLIQIVIAQQIVIAGRVCRSVTELLGARTSNVKIVAGQ